MTNRPLSPHLQVYRLPLTAILSISHRFTGVVLSIGVIYGVFLLLAAASGPDAFAAVHRALQTWLGLGFLWVWLFAFVFHLCHGARHLLWDTLRGLERHRLARHGMIELGASVAFFLALLVYAYVA